MAVPTIRQILTGIEGRLRTIDGLRVTDYAPGQINPPQAIILAPPVASYQQGMGRRPFLEPTVTVLVSAALDRIGQLALADYSNPTGTLSVVAAIAADPTLGGLAVQCQVRSFDQLTVEEVGQLGYFGGKFHLRVTT